MHTRTYNNWVVGLKVTGARGKWEPGVDDIRIYMGHNFGYVDRLLRVRGYDMHRKNLKFQLYLRGY